MMNQVMMSLNFKHPVIYGKILPSSRFTALPRALACDEQCLDMVASDSESGRKPQIFFDSMPLTEQVRVPQEVR